jgi:NCAIR mutase (PurE)-related protein
MLNSCSPNVTVVNIDNGFGAAYVAAMIVRSVDRVVKQEVASESPVS